MFCHMTKDDWICSLCLRMTSYNTGLNSTFIGAAKDLEKAVCAPVVVPAVSHQPVGSALLSAPTNDFDGMSAQYASGDMLVNACKVEATVLIT